MTKSYVKAGIFVLVLWLGLFLAGPVQAKQVNITDYQVDLASDEHGVIKQTERITYDIHGQVDQVRHQIALGDVGEMEALKIDMRSSDAKSAFPFALSDSHEVGTFFAQQDDSMLQVNVFNKMSDSQQIARYQSTINRSWTNYGDQAILSLPLLSAPGAVDEAVVRVKFPQAVKAEEAQILTSPQQKTQWRWLNDKELEIQVRDKGAGESILLQAYIPAQVLANNPTVGPESKGQTIVQEMDQEAEKRANKLRRQSVFIWGMLALLVLALLILAYFLLREKYRVAQEAATYPLPLGSVHPYQVLALRTKSTAKSRFYASLFNLYQEGLVDLAYQDQGKKQKIDLLIQIQVDQATSPQDQALLSVGQSLAGGQAFYVSDLLETKQLRQALVKDQARLMSSGRVKFFPKARRNKWYRLLFLAYLILALALTVGALVLMLEMDTSYGALLGYGLCLLLALVLYRKALPIYTPQGLSRRRTVKALVEDLKSKEWTDQEQKASEAELSQGYLLSWFTGTNDLYYNKLVANGYLPGQVQSWPDALYDKDLTDLIWK
ncbi:MULTISPECIES: DUF2207 domain-containing protein [Aerococcus]|uniref:DUF2207 domain-containing protein n=1 Tax=Aerococcus sanguinicola TaxID=119206 RepID=A0A5N1GJA7_9LACT|nr:MULTISPECIES: DUF2207 domain-containing protein [Aerococcus]KAA9300388.1 DUF2207 domain-containing protein [Aerococcus sanguinicola]MDK6368976.1 DUF2207 domain-containing protein [Aerococcus sp. UMB9870]MDK6678879.1 DUF2207 domain-containing protein [Aerococcus sp. UMB8608]MDK6686803.1 DUF2207 domain-containing protein [Aerococcus sp. UMB8623]MDK6939537.1 DUF2207 domain-containing protein [Aerococcus sp. UMB8487]